MSKAALDLELFCLKTDKNKYLQLGEALITSNIGKAFSLLSFGLSLDESKRQQYYILYFNVLESWSNILLQDSRYEDVLKVFDVAQDLYPQSPDLKYLLAYTLFRIGKTREAWEYSLTVLKTCRNDPKARDLVSNLTNALVDRWHFPMINDSQRNEKYREGLRKCLQNNRGSMSVLDIGAGSGLLSIYASQLGGNPVFACEVDEFMCEMAENVLKTNLVNAEVILLNCHSENLDIPSKISSRVAVVVTETFDAGFFGEGILSTLNHAWSNLLLPSLSDDSEPTRLTTKETHPLIPAKEYGIVLPRSAEIWVAVLECNYIAKQTKIMSKYGHLQNIDINFQMKEPYLSEKVNNLPGKYKLLTNWKKVLDVNLNSPTKIEQLLNGQENKIIRFITEREGRMDGIILAYKLFIDQDNYISTFPDSETCWENAIYPMKNLESIQKGNEIEVDMKFDNVLHFNAIESRTSRCKNNSTLNLTDSMFFKCINSSSFIEFYNNIGKTFYNKRGQNAGSLTILDTCPYPEGGLSLLDLCPNNRLCITNESALQALSEGHVEVELDENDHKFDIIFLWPFSAEGTLKQNIFEELKMYRKRLTKNGRLFPEHIYLHVLGINSPHIAKMTRIDNSNTCGINISDIFDLLKTRHHLDVPIEGLPYEPRTPVLTPLRLDLEDLKANLFGEIVTEESPDKFLVVGGSVIQSFLPFEATSKGSIDGFVYWFELSSFIEKNESPTDPIHVPNSSEEDENSMTSPPGDVETSTLTVNADASVKSKRVTQNLSTFSSLSRDSPINQCVLLLDQPFLVDKNRNLILQFAFSEAHFSVNLKSVEESLV